MKKVCYAVMLQSQLGPRTGELMLQEDAQVVSGYLSLLGHQNRFSGSVLQEGKYLDLRRSALSGGQGAL